MYKRASSENIRNLKQFLKQDELRFTAHYKCSISHELKLDEFNIIVTIGKGSFATVYLVQEKRTQMYYALKQIRKKSLVELSLIDSARQEKRCLQSTNFPFLIYLKYFFSDNNCLYFVLPFLIGGELYSLLRKSKLDETHSQFYAAQIVLALEYLHYMKIIYRDLKPENLLIDRNGYIKVTDFGFSKLIKGRTYSFCGTPEYMAPEIILNKGYGFAVDWWSLGIILYEMNHGQTPFHHWDQAVLYEKITSGKYSIPLEFSDSLKDILSKLINLDLTQRLGNLRYGVDDIKQHAWFSTIPWLEILNREVTPPYKPQVADEKDVSHFGTYSTEELPIAETEEYPYMFSNF